MPPAASLPENGTVTFPYRRTWLLALMGPILGALFFLVSLLNRHVTIACTRAVCTVESDSLFVAFDPDTIPLDHIRGCDTVVASSRGAKNPTFDESIVISLTDDDVYKVDDYSLLDVFTSEKADAAHALDAFLHDKTKPSISVTIGDFTSLVLLATIAYLFAIPVLLYFALARLTISRKHGQVTLALSNGRPSMAGDWASFKLQDGYALEADPKRKTMAVRKGDQPRVDLPVPAMSRAQFDELAEWLRGLLQGGGTR